MYNRVVARLLSNFKKGPSNIFCSCLYFLRIKYDHFRKIISNFLTLPLYYSCHFLIGCFFVSSFVIGQNYTSRFFTITFAAGGKQTIYDGIDDHSSSTLFSTWMEPSESTSNWQKFDLIVMFFVQIFLEMFWK
jgi:hypothetical protein